MLAAPKYPISAFPVKSDHGDVHTIHVCRSNGDSLTVSDYKWVFWRITGRELEDHEVNVDVRWFAPEDRI